jgi:hypothetical protein
MSAEKTDRTPTIKEQKPGTRIPIGRGIYRYKDLNGEVTYHERPWINGKRTWRALGYNFTTQRSQKLAEEEYHRRRAGVAAGRNPYEEKKSEPKSEKATVEVVIQKYIDDKFPDRYLQPRTGRTLEGEQANCETLLLYCEPEKPWHNKLWDSLTPKSWDDYHEWRLANINEKVGDADGDEDANPEPKPQRGNRMVDLERNTLLNAGKYAIRKELATSNPVRDFPKFHSSAAVKHCREFCPRSADELHEIAGLLFAKRRSEALGWQLLFEAYTGLRTSEILKFRMDAKPGSPGFLDEQGNLHTGQRLKRGINPFVHCHEGLRALLKAHAAWHAIRYPDNPFYIPGKSPGQPMRRRTLAHALHSLKETIGRKITSHGMRAFYVLIRRSWGIDDGQIAVELGQRSGAALIASTYGDVPPNWRNGGGPKLGWLQKGEPAWAELEKTGWKREEEDLEEASEVADIAEILPSFQTSTRSLAPTDKTRKRNEKTDPRVPRELAQAC